jgi:hypothetical protein
VALGLVVMPYLSVGGMSFSSLESSYSPATRLAHGDRARGGAPGRRHE